MKYELTLCELSPDGFAQEIGLIELDWEDARPGTVVDLLGTLVKILEIREEGECVGEALVECINPAESFLL